MERLLWAKNYNIPWAKVFSNSDLAHAYSGTGVWVCFRYLLKCLTLFFGLGKTEKKVFNLLVRKEDGKFFYSMLPNNFRILSGPKEFEFVFLQLQCNPRFRTSYRYGNGRLFGWHVYILVASQFGSCDDLVKRLQLCNLSHTTDRMEECANKTFLTS